MGTKPQVQLVEISEAQAGQRIDNFLLKTFKGVPKSRIYSIIRKGEVRVNKGRIKQGYRLESGDMVRIPPVRMDEKQEPPKISHQLHRLLTDSILFEDDVLIVINKPSGIAVHGGSGVSLGIIEAFRAIYPNLKFLELVHRLDKGTSGCMLLAKKRSALLDLQDQLKQSAMEKDYLMVVAGRWKGKKHTVDASLYKYIAASGERRVRVSREGKHSVTHFTVLEHFDRTSLVEARLETGRTHQIRVHGQFSGHSIIGDDKYGDDKANDQACKDGCRRLCLHAQKLAFKHPVTNESVSFTATVDTEMRGFIEKLRNE